MTARSCRACGEPEQRWVDGRGRRHVNLDPTTGLCVRCIGDRAARRTALERRRDARPQTFDARAAAARNDD
jgi:hypothetical protein